MNDIIERIALVECNPANHGGRRDKSAIKYLVYHYTGNDGDHDTNNAIYYRDNVVKASAHYFVDDDSITQSVGDLTVAWAVGGSKWSDCDKTGGGSMHGIVTNTNSLSIEMCDTVKDGTYNVTEKTLENAAALGRMLMERYGIPVENVVRHFDVTGKQCPQYFMDNDKWADFKARLTAREDDVKRYNRLGEIEKEAPWAAPTVQKLIALGCIQGSGAKPDANGNPTDMNLSEDILRVLVINDRAGVYGE